jgi:hypothetical protein
MRVGRRLASVDMSQATSPTAPAPSLPRRVPGRSTQIATLHSTAEWFAEHVDQAVPRFVTLTALVDTDEQLGEWAAAHGVEVISTPTFANGDPSITRYAAIRLSDLAETGVDIVYSVTSKGLQS